MRYVKTRSDDKSVNKKGVKGIRTAYHKVCVFVERTVKYAYS